ncbi:glutamate--cysteine ligase [Kordiimonas lacus]|uniref:Gamma-glutamyl:cysteine ligase YbdK, ATP-grasp superfamily n=1 Tax=Kordiimonas lacus TaxID=637679 RepID=A0A1G7CNV1_9PROT|nr:glutamate--cysteine ligase [Kordiimonas lacus]SDE40346.1 Gamma-glutamyl:cysteine ligase YbdK, ATP-grasp superfamily [Kordiimonas lacus]
MGQELDTSEFRDEDYEAFGQRLRAETDLVETWEQQGALSNGPATAGFELEAWLVGPNMHPVPQNDAFIKALDSPLVVPELSCFNVEFNGDPAELTGGALSDLHADLAGLWDRAVDAAAKMDLKLAMIGILPTVKGTDLCTENMSAGQRYKALNEQVFRLRKGKPIKLDIEGREHLVSDHMDVMLEAAATSFQIHLKVPNGRGVDYYNASKLASAPLVAVSANSPYLFGRDLWAESRIPLFEQAVSVGDWDYEERVTFGVRFIEKSLSEVFLANRQRYPILLPHVTDREAEKLDHFRLQNGTIWRWNRPLVGWDEDGTPHFRLEQRVVPAGPTIADSMANSAFYYGLVTYLANADTRPHKRAQFFTTRDNFYLAARDGLGAVIRWDHQDGKPMRQLIQEVFLPMAEEGLQSLNVDPADIHRYLGIIRGRAETGQNGATWQRAFVRTHGASMEEMLEAYMARQQTDTPVHEWPL